MRYRFGDFVLDSQIGSLAGPSGPIHLRPQTQHLLEVLLETAPALVSHDELLDRVWGVEHLSPGSLAQAVSELRQALEDDARQPMLIETVPRRGYRFVAPVTSGPRNAELPAAVPPDALPRRRSLTRPVLLAVILAVLAGSAALLLPQSRGERPPRAPHGLVVQPPSTPSGDARLEGTAQTVAGWLAAGLAEHSELPVRLGEDDGLLTLSGTIRRQHDGFTLVLRLCRHGGEILQSWQLRSHDTSELERGLGEALPHLRDTVVLETLRQALADEDRWLGYCAGFSESPTTLRSFSGAWELFLERRYREAAQLSRDITAAEPDFWPAAFLLALAEKNLEDVAAAKAAVASALERAPADELPVRLALEELAAALDGRWELAARRLEKLTGLLPGSDLMTYELARALCYAGRQAEARPLILDLLERGWRTEWPAPRLLACHILLADGEVGPALEVARVAAARFPDHATVMATLALLASMAGMTAEAEEAADRSARIAAQSTAGFGELLDLGPAKLRAVVAVMPARGCERLAGCEGRQSLNKAQLLPWTLVVDGCRLRDERLADRAAAETDLGGRLAAAWLACPGPTCEERVNAAAALDPDLAVARYELAVLWLEAGDPERAGEWLRRARTGVGYDAVWEQVDPAFARSCGAFNVAPQETNDHRAIP